MSNNSSCLNCGQSVTGKFCSTCGQKANTHRISLPHFIGHDLLHGIWHVERSMLFTLKEVLIYPGRVARNYIHGQRVRYYNFFTLLIWVFALDLFVSHLIEQVSPDFHPNADADTPLFKLIDNNAKLFMLGLLPLIALSAFAVFRRLKYNYTEHLVPATLAMIGWICIDILSNLVDWTLGIENMVVIPVVVLYGFMTYYQLSDRKYTFGGYLWRMLAAFILFCAIIILLVKLGAYLMNK